MTYGLFLVSDLTPLGDLHSKLQKIGFNEIEAKMYLLLLHLGAQPASVIAKYSGKGRSTIYPHLKKLLEKNLVVKTRKKNCTLFRAIDPEYIGFHISQRKEEILYQEQMYNSLLPELKKMNPMESTIPKVSVFEGVSEVERAYSYLTKLENPKFVVGDPLAPTAAHLKNAYQITNTPHTAYRTRQKVLSREEFPLQGGITIFEDSITIETPPGRAQSLIHIKNPEVSHLFSSLCRYIWNS